MRTPLTRLLFFLSAAAVIATVLACGAGQREKTIKATLISVNAERDAFGELDLKAQQAIVAACNPPECFEAEARRRIEAYREQRAKILASFEAVYRALAIAATSDVSLRSMLDAIAKLKAALSVIQKEYLQGALRELGPVFTQTNARYRRRTDSKPHRNAEL